MPKSLSHSFLSLCSSSIVVRVVRCQLHFSVPSLDFSFASLASCGSGFIFISSTLCMRSSQLALVVSQFCSRLWLFACLDKIPDVY